MLTVNGEPTEVAFAPYKTLLEVLREDLNLCGTKHGCELGECGACAVLLDGQPVLSCLVLGVEVVGELGVDRNEIVDAADLDAVTGIVHHGDVRIAGGLGEVADRALEVDDAEILLGGHDVEPGLLEHLGDRGRVIHRIVEPDGVLIAGIADHQRDTAFRVGRVAGQHRQEEPASCNQREKKLSHLRLRC